MLYTLIIRIDSFSNICNICLLDSCVVSLGFAVHCKTQCKATVWEIKSSPSYFLCGYLKMPDMIQFNY